MRRPAVKRLRLEEQRSLSNQLIASNPWASLAWVDLTRTIVSLCVALLNAETHLAAPNAQIACRKISKNTSRERKLLTCWPGTMTVTSLKEGNHTDRGVGRWALSVI
jgi:hypothetical protein